MELEHSNVISLQILKSKFLSLSLPTNNYSQISKIRNMARADNSTVSSVASSMSFQDNSGTTLSSYEDEPSGDFFEIKNKGIVDILGNASDGLSVMVILPCKIPSDERGHFDYTLLRRYVTSMLDAHSDTVYYVLYFHCDTVSETGSSKQWLRDLFHSVTEKDSRTNIRRFFIVHPTPFIRTLYYLTAPLLLWKFKQKVRYVNTLRHLKRELPYGELIFQLPIHVLEQDKMIEDHCRSNLQDEQKARSLVPQPIIEAVHRLRRSREDLQRNKDTRNHNRDAGVPFAIKHCVDYLSEPAILSMEDLFVSSNYNISGSHLVMDALKRGAVVELEDYKDPAMVAAVLKQIFREMAEPLFPYDLYDDVVAFNNTRNKMAAAQALVLYRLPKRNFEPLAFLLAFLLRVLDFREVNRSSAKSLAAIFAPLLMRPKDNHASLAESTIEMYDAAEFLKFLLDNFLQVFTF